MKKHFLIFFILIGNVFYGQKKINIKAFVDENNKTILVQQSFEYTNNYQHTISEIVLNDWNHALSSKNTAISQKFSDEFVRNFYLSKKIDKSYTKINSIKDDFTFKITRNPNQIDLLLINFTKPLKPNEQIKFEINYTVKLPNAKFTRYGFTETEKFLLKNCFLSYSANNLKYSEYGIDDQCNEKTDYSIEINLPEQYKIVSNLTQSNNLNNTYYLNGNQMNNLFFYIDKKLKFESFKNNHIEVLTNIEAKDVNEYEKAFIVEKITNYTQSILGQSQKNKIIVLQEDYDREPFYGLNSLPSILSPFNDDFLFELKFLKTYLNAYLQENLTIDFRKDHWILESIQHYVIKKYIDENYPDIKASGKLSKFKLLKGYRLINMPFTEQFVFNYLLMARKNLDQPIGIDKSEQIKFNEKIAGKFKSGLLLNYLSVYTNYSIEKGIKFFIENQKFQNTNDFLITLQKYTEKDISWFNKEFIYSRKEIDFTSKSIKKDANHLTFTISSKHNFNIPIPITYKDYSNTDKIIWVKPEQISKPIDINNDSIKKITINSNYLIPEYNYKNNFIRTKKRGLGNKPLQFTFFRDLENYNKNQVFFVPTAEYNYYDGLLLGMTVNNKSLIDKAIEYSITPNISTKTGTLAGFGNISLNQLNRYSTNHSNRISLGATRLHYAPDAFYTKITPSISFRFRNPDFRKNEGESILIRNVYVNREPTAFVTNIKENENYSIFNIRYNYSFNELTKTKAFSTDFQVAQKFGKLSGQYYYRKLFENNRHVTFRAFAGFFTHLDTKTDYFNFGLDTPKDYLFDYSFIGRSESTGLLSQQFFYGDGGFKSKFETRTSNQYMLTTNFSFNIWNWVEIYTDFGTMKSTNFNPEYFYGTGIHLNLVQDYFELFFPMYSNNGFEPNLKNYQERVRFIITISPKTLSSLVTRRWF